MPPTERKGRVHTSTCTVAVVPALTADLGELARADLSLQWFSGTGAGGQHRNKHQNSLRLKHLPTGIVVTAQCRSRENSYAQAHAELQRLVAERSSSAQHESLSANRQAMVGSGMRGDKFRTYRFQDNLVKDDRTGKVTSCKEALRGGLSSLWN